MHCNNCVHTLGIGSYSNSFGFNWLLSGSRNHAQVSGSMCSGDGTYSCLIMRSSYVEFNAPDVEGSLPGYLP